MLKCMACGHQTDKQGRYVGQKCPNCKAGVYFIAPLVSMEFQTYHDLAKRTLGDHENQELFCAMMLGSEAGEILGVLQKEHWQGHERDARRLLNEVGDLLWAASMLLDSRGYTLEDAARANVDKLRARYPEGFTSERSVNRAKEDV